MESNWILYLNIVNAALGIAVAYYLGKVTIAAVKDIRSRKEEKNRSEYSKVA
jgi:hypothetical protein